MSVSTSSRRNGRPRGYVDDWRPQAKTRKLLADVGDVLDRYAEHLPLTVRQIFYALVGAEQLDKTEEQYTRLCYALNIARRAKRIEFADIRDDGVTGNGWVAYTSIEDFHDATAERAKKYRRDRQEGQIIRLELWCEAAGMVPQLEDIAADYSIPVFSAGGFASLSAVRQIVNRAVRRDVPSLILHVGDYDPSGESIFTAMSEDAAAFVEADRTLATSRIDALRVALTAEQVAEFDLPTAPAKATDSRSNGWHGGTCQLEALPPDVLAEMVRTAILDQLDVYVLGLVLAQERAERAQLLGLPRGDR